MDDGRGNFYWQDGARHAHDGWWDGPFHALFALLLLALLVVGVIWLVKRVSPAAQAAVPGAVPAALPTPVTSADPAVAVLRMRYAKGEVSREDFQNAIADLTGSAPTASGHWPGTGPGAETAENPPPTAS